MRDQQGAPRAQGLQDRLQPEHPQVGQEDLRQGGQQAGDVSNARGG